MRLRRIGEMTIDPTVESFLDYMRFERNASENTVRAYENDLRGWQEHCRNIGEPLYPVKPDAMARYLKRLEAEGLSSATRMRRAAALSAFAKYLVYDGTVGPGAPLTKIPKREKTLPQVMTEGEIERLLAACDDGSPSGQRDRAMIEMLYGCGLRASEICGLKLVDVDDTGGVLYVRGKGDKERMVPFVGTVRNVIRAYVAGARATLLTASGAKDPGTLFVSDKGRTLSRGWLWGMIRARGTAAGIAEARLHPHVLRHSFATHLQRGGMDIRTLQELLGHASIATTEKYTHLDTEIRDLYDTFHPRA